MHHRFAWLHNRFLTARLATCSGPPPAEESAAALPPGAVVVSRPARSAARAAMVASVVAFQGCSGPPAPLPVGPTYTDTFTDSAGVMLPVHTPDAGGSWSVHTTYTGSAKITAAGRARGDGSWTSALYWSGDPPSADYDVSADVYIASGSGTAGLLARVNTTTESYVFATYTASAGSGVLSLGFATPGVGRTTMASSTPGWGVGSTHRVLLRVSGSSASVYVNGTLTLGPVTVGSLPAGKTGLIFFSTGATDSTLVQIDNFLAPTPGPPASPPPPVGDSSLAIARPTNRWTRTSAWRAQELVRTTPPPGTTETPPPASIASGRRLEPRRAAKTAYDPGANATVLLPTPPPPSPPPPNAPFERSRRPGRAAASAYAASIGWTDLGTVVVGEGYHVYANDGAGGPIDYATPVATTTATSWTSSALSHPGSWLFGVRAYNAYGEERNLDCALEIDLDAAGVDVTRIPTPPYSLRAIPLKAGAVRLTWYYSGPNRLKRPTSFNVYCGSPSVDYGTVRAVAAYTGQSFYSVDLAGLSDGVQYAFGVRAANATGEESNTLSVSCTADATGPDAVVGLSLSTVSLEGS